MESSVTQSFFTSDCNLLILLSRVSGILFFKNYGHFHFDLGLVNYQAVQNMDVGKFCHDLWVVSWGTIMYEMITLMYPPQYAKMLFQNVNINTFFYWYIFSKEYKQARPRFLLKTPHTITLAGSFIILAVNFGSYRDALLGRRTIFGTPLTSVKVFWSLNLSFLHSAAV